MLMLRRQAAYLLLSLCAMSTLQREYGDEGVKALQAKQDAERKAARQNVDANLIPLGTRAPAAPAVQAESAEPIPDVEWWDARILMHPESYDLPMNESDR